MARRAAREMTDRELDEILAAADRAVEVAAVEVIEDANDDFSELTATEERDRKRLERKVEKAFFEAGSALQELRDKRLYRNTHDTFEDYCRERFGHSRQKSYYLMAGAEIYQTLSTNRCQILPTTEYQVRPLAVLEPPQQPVAWNEAVKEAEGKVPPARLVRESVRRIQAESRENPHYVGEVVCILSKDEPQLRGRNGCWAIVLAVHEHSCDLQLWNGLVELIKLEYFRSMNYTEEECQALKRLCIRIKRLRERDDLEDTAYAFLGLLGKLKRPHLTDLEEEMLTVLERAYGLKKVGIELTN